MILKKADKEALLRFQQLCDTILSATADERVAESEKDKDKRINMLFNSYAAFVKYYFPHYATAECGDFHQKAARKIKKEKDIRAVLEWARGHAKSTHADIMIPMFLKAQKDLRVMVLVGKNENAAKTLLSDVQAELQFNQRYIRDFGEQFKFGSWEEGNFVTRDDCAFFALGRGQSPRGLRHRQFRPDYIVMDDCDDDKLSRNPRLVSETFDWALEALLGTMDMGRGRFIVVGNRISRNSLIAYFSELKSFWTLKVNALDKYGKPSWHQKYTKEEIEKQIETIGYRRAQKEYFNNPIVEGAVFKSSWIRFEQPLPLKDYRALIAYCDPSFKGTSTSDYKAIVLIGRRADATIDVLDAFVRKCSINEMVRWWYSLHESLPQIVSCRHYMEANFLQDLIFDEFNAEGKSRGYILPITGDKRSKPDKFARIEAMSPIFERGLIRFNINKEKHADMQELKEQLLTFERGSRTHDDAPDALEGALHIMQTSPRLYNNTRGSYTPRKNRHF